MAWRKLEDTFHSDRKIRKLARELGIPEPHAAGHIVTLWSWALLHAKDGDLSKFDVDDIEYGAKWAGAHGTFLHACVTTGLIDDDQNGSVILHNWITRGGSFADSQRKRLEKQKKSVADCNVQEIPGSSRKIQERPGKSPLEENRREENIYSREATDADAPGEIESGSKPDPKTDRDDIQEVWSHYRAHHPQTVAVLRASRKEYKLIRQRLDDFGVDDLKRAIDGYHRSPWHTGGNPDRKKYLSLELMLRDIGHVTTGLEMLEQATSGNGAPRRLIDSLPGARDTEH